MNRHGYPRTAVVLFGLSLLGGYTSAAGHYADPGAEPLAFTLDVAFATVTGFILWYGLACLIGWAARRLHGTQLLTLGETARFTPGDWITVNNDQRKVLSIVGNHSVVVRRPWFWELRS